jgi:hypothetical protein
MRAQFRTNFNSEGESFMKTIPAALAAILGIVAIPGFAAAPTTNVNVTNTPLPVSVTNPTTTVQVGNTSPLAVSVANPLDLVKADANAHFQRGSFTGAPNTPFDNFCIASTTVPTGQRLLVHYIGFRLRSAAVMTGGEIDVTSSGGLVFQTFFTVPAASGFLTGGQVVDFAADGGDTVSLGVSLNGLDPSVACDFAISGTLVSNP